MKYFQKLRIFYGMIKIYKGHFFTSFICFYVTILVSCKKSTESTLPTEKAINEAVYASGNIFPKNEYKLFASTEGTILAQLAQEGEAVKKNQLLLSIENTSQAARSQAAELIYRQSQSNAAANSPILKELENQIAILRQKLENDQANYQRQKELWAENATTKILVEGAELQQKTTTNQLKAAEYGLQKVRNQLKMELENAQANFKINSREDQNYQIRAFSDGIIYEILKKQGEQVRRGEVVALMGHATENYLQLAVDETDFLKIQVGQKALIKLDMAGQKSYQATITKKYPKLNRIDQTFRVDAEFDGENPGAYYGLTLEANILIKQKAKALTVPKTYLVGTDSLLIEENGQTKQIKVSKGLENLDDVEILSGITKNTKILKPNS